MANDPSSASMNSADSRGVMRGKCKECTTCDGYHGGKLGMKCTLCHHSPTSHQNMSGHPTRQSTFPDPLMHDPTSDTPAGYSQDQYPKVSLPICKATGCDKTVHLQDGIGAFDYCSPKCRDRHLIPKEQVKLEKDLEDLYVQLSASSTATATGGPTNYGRAGTSLAVGQGRMNVVSHCFKVCKDRGIILYGRGKYQIDSTTGLLVSGVVVRSSAYEMLKKGEIALLGVVTHINGSTVDGFNAKLETPHCLVVQYDSKISVGCSKTFLEVQQVGDATHMVVLMNPHSIGQKDYGFIAKQQSSNIVVTITNETGVARESGLRNGDVIVTYALVTKENFEPCKIHPIASRSFEMDIKDASREGKSLLLVVKRKI